MSNVKFRFPDGTGRIFFSGAASPNSRVTVTVTMHGRDLAKFPQSVVEAISRLEPGEALSITIDNGTDEGVPKIATRP